MAEEGDNPGGQTPSGGAASQGGADSPRNSATNEGGRAGGGAASGGGQSQGGGNPPRGGNAGGAGAGGAGGANPSGSQPQGGGGAGQAGGAAGGSSGGGTPWGKILLGCGCVGILALVCAGVGTVAASGYIFSSTAKQIENGVEVQQEYVDRREKFVEDVELEDPLESDVTKEDFEQLESTVQSWKDSEPFRDLETLIESDGPEGDSFFAALQAAYQVWQSLSAWQALGNEYVSAIESHGGVEAHYRRMLRVGAVLAAVHEVASDHRFEGAGDATSDEIAKVLADDYERVLDKYGGSVREMKGESLTYSELARSDKLGKYALANLGPASFETWKNFSAERRQKMIETFGWSLTAEAVTFGGLPYTLSLGHDPLGGN